MHDDPHDKGLAHDLKTLSASMANRRQVLLWVAGASLLPVVGCGESTTGDSTTTSSATGGGGCATIPEETAGPFPGDGSIGPNALADSGIVRSDIRSSFGAMSGTAEGVPMTLKLTLVDAGASCAPLAGYAIYIWHCDRDGGYSMYTVSDQNYLRGVQETDDTGTATFLSIFPGCYPGRWPHIHFEIFPDLARATASENTVKISQLALPEGACKEAYAADGYSQSASNLSQISLTSDMVFSDGSEHQVASVTGNATDGYVATLTVAIGA